MCNLYSGMPSGDYEGETRSVRLGGHSTSIRIEVMFWNVLEDIAASQGMTLPRLVTLLYDEVLALHGEARNFASLLRCACLRHLEMKVTMASSHRADGCALAGERRPVAMMESPQLG
jgi:predicted DNA-binding ribbon-helix-helix protein